MKTRFMGVLLVTVLALATVPAGYAVVEDPDYKVMEPYGYDPDRHDATFDQAYERTVRALKAKPESELTAAEADWLGDRYRTRNGLTQDLDKAEHYYLLATDKDPEYAPVYVGLAILYGKKREYQKELWAKDRFIMLNPDGLYGTAKDPYWSSIASTLRDMERLGYDVPDNLPAQFDRIEEEGVYKDLESREDLERMGYLRIREKHLVPLMQADSPIKARVVQGLSNSELAKEAAKTGYFPVLVGLAVLAAIVVVVVGLKLGRRIVGAVR